LRLAPSPPPSRTAWRRLDDTGTAPFGSGFSDQTDASSVLVSNRAKLEHAKFAPNHAHGRQNDHRATGVRAAAFGNLWRAFDWPVRAVVIAASAQENRSDPAPRIHEQEPVPSQVAGRLTAGKRMRVHSATLAPVTRKQASDTLNQRIAAAGHSKVPTRSRVTFRTLAGEWDASVLPMYKHSTQKHRRFMLKKHLLPRFGDMAVSDVTRQEIQVYVAHLAQAGYAPKSIDHVHDVLSAVLRTAVKWGQLQENPARGVDLPTLKCVRPGRTSTSMHECSRCERRCTDRRRIDHDCSQPGKGWCANSLKRLVRLAGLDPARGERSRTAAWLKTAREASSRLRAGAPCRTRTCDLLVRSLPKGDNRGQHGAAAPDFIDVPSYPQPPETTPSRYRLSVICQSTFGTRRRRY
jgi:hypothetical protein